VALRCLALDVASDARRTADLSTTLRSVEKHSQERSAELQIPPLRYAPVGMTNLCVQVNLSSRPERSVVERSAVLLSSLRVGHRFRGSICHRHCSICFCIYLSVPQSKPSRKISKLKAISIKLSPIPYAIFV
jgi:hypothetical protein